MTCLSYSCSFPSLKCILWNHCTTLSPDAAIKKMLATLNDPFTRFLEPEKFKSLRVWFLFSLVLLAGELTPPRLIENLLPKQISSYVFWRQSGTQNALTGVGLSIGYPLGKKESASGLVVISASPGGPANRAGISSGDIILQIDNTSTENMGIYDAAERLQ